MNSLDDQSDYLTKPSEAVCFLELSSRSFNRS